LSTDLHHGDVLLMSQNFQQQFKHCTIPATEWSTTTWATEAAQNCKRKPTPDAPRINLTARYIKNHNCAKQPRQPVELTAPPTPPPPEPTPADAEAQEQLRTLRAKIESHEAVEQDMQREIAELERQNAELAERRAKKFKPNTKPNTDERSQRIGRLRAKSLHEAAAAALAEYSYTVIEQLGAFSNQIIKESCGPEDKLFKSGYVRLSRLHRVLMRYDQLDYALREAVGDAKFDHTEDLSKARIVFTAGEGGVSQGEGQIINAWSLINGVATRPFEVYPGQQLCISMFELSFEFHLGIHRTTLRAPPGRNKAAATKHLVKTWHKMILAEKVRQLHRLKELPELIPNLPSSYGPCDTLEAMPCVVWLCVEQGALKKARQM